LNEILKLSLQYNDRSKALPVTIGNGKARPRALPFGLQALLVFPRYDVCGWCNENLTRKATMLGAVHSDLNEEKKQKIDL